MKRIIALSLLWIHLFNIGGQLAIRQYFVYKSDKLFDEQINKNRYNVNDLTEIKIPANMPEVHDWRHFEILNGRVQFQYSSYNYVKIKITHNAIYLLCVPNYATTHLSDQNIIYARQIPDIPVSKKDHVPLVKLNFATFSNICIHYKFENPVVITRGNIFINHSMVRYSAIAGPGQPPDFLIV